MSFGNLIMGYGERVLGTLAQCRLGIVTAYDPETHMAKVKLSPEDEEIITPWLPIESPLASDALTVRYAPEIGMHARLEAQEADANAYVITGFFHSTTMSPPQAPNDIDGEPVMLEPGEMLIKLKDGATFRINKDGSIFIQSPTEVRMQAPNFRTKGTWDHEGTFHATDDIMSDADVKDFHGTLDGLRQNYNSHRHTGVQTGGGQTGTTTAAD